MKILRTKLLLSGSIMDPDGVLGDFIWIKRLSCLLVQIGKWKFASSDIHKLLLLISKDYSIVSAKSRPAGRFVGFNVNFVRIQILALFWTRTFWNALPIALKR